MPTHQLLLMVGNDEMYHELIRINKELGNIPTKDQNSEDAIAYAHYFYGGSDWYILDRDGYETFFGYAILNNDVQMSEYGRVGVDEIVNNGKVELDFYFTPKSLKKILYQKDKNYFENPDKETKKEVEASVKETPKPAAEKLVVADVIHKDIVDHYSNEFMLIRRFYNVVKTKGVVSFRKIQLLFMAFEKAALERKVRKASPDADLFTTVNEKVVKLFNAVKSDKESVNVALGDDKCITKLESYVGGKTVNYAIALLKRFISLQGTTPENTKVNSLIKAIETAFKNGKVDRTNRLFAEVEQAKKALLDYLDEPKQKIEATPQGLSKPANFKLKGSRKTTFKLPAKKLIEQFKKASVKRLKSKKLLKKKVKTNTIKVAPITQKAKSQKPKATKPTKIVKEMAISAKRKKVGMNKGIVPTLALPDTLHNLAKPLNYKSDSTNGIYAIGGSMARFLGKIEVKPIHSLAITLDAPQGAGKTRYLFEAANEFAKNGYKCLFVSLEEHPQSNLFIDKVKKYISPEAEKNINTIGELPNGYKTLEDLIPHYDIIFIDSWGKITEQNSGIDFDSDLRRKFNSKLFFVIFQRTQDGKMRGGSKAQFDGDVILKISKADDFRENYVYADKNRYQHNDLSQLHYNIFKNRLNNPTTPNFKDNNVKRITINL